MNIRFQADNDPHEDIMRSTKRLRSDIDFQRAPELGLHLGIGDPEVLRLCAEQGRMLVTHDRHTMPGHFIEFIQISRLARHLHRFKKTFHRQSRGMAGPLLGGQ